MNLRAITRVVGVVAVLLQPLLQAGCWVDSRFERVPESVCASREIWTYADKDSPLMNPGRSCVQCHAEENDPTHAPLYTVAGTVMLAPTEEDDCRGAGSMTVTLTDANGSEWTMIGNSAGNFWLDPSIIVAMPYTARIEDAAGNVRQKQIAVSDGDCGACHTADTSAGGPGRLLPPLVQ